MKGHRSTTADAIEAAEEERMAQEAVEEAKRVAVKAKDEAINARFDTVTQSIDNVKRSVDDIKEQLAGYRKEVGAAMDGQREMLTQEMSRCMQVHGEKFDAYTTQHGKLHEAHDLVHSAMANRVYAIMTLVGGIAATALGVFMYYFLTHDAPVAYTAGAVTFGYVFVGGVTAVGYLDSLRLSFGHFVGRVLSTRLGNKLVSWYIARKFKK
jgi:phage-related protein